MIDSVAYPMNYDRLFTQMMEVLPGILKTAIVSKSGRDRFVIKNALPGTIFDEDTMGVIYFHDVGVRGNDPGAGQCMEVVDMGFRVGVRQPCSHDMPIDVWYEQISNISRMFMAPNCYSIPLALTLDGNPINTRFRGMGWNDIKIGSPLQMVDDACQKQNYEWDVTFKLYFSLPEKIII